MNMMAYQNEPSAYRLATNPGSSDIVTVSRPISNFNCSGTTVNDSRTVIEAVRPPSVLSSGMVAIPVSNASGNGIGQCIKSAVGNRAYCQNSILSTADSQNLQYSTVQLVGSVSLPHYIVAQGVASEPSRWSYASLSPQNSTYVPLSEANQIMGMSVQPSQPANQFYPLMPEDAQLSLNVPLREENDCPQEPVEAVNETEVTKDSTPPPSTSADEQSLEEEPEGEIDIQIRNVVCNYTLPLHIDLRRIALKCGNVTFDRGRGVLLKQRRNPSCYVKVYSSGKIYIVGCRSESECKRAARYEARTVQRLMGRLGDTVRIQNYRVCNVLATCKMPFGIKIEELALKYPDRSQYEPELSVGLVWRSIDPKATLRIHTTGSITVTGAVSENEVMRAIQIIYPIVKEFRCAYRLRAEGVTIKGTQKNVRKRGSSVLSYSQSASKRPCQQAFPTRVEETRGVLSSSCVIGNRIYFSDEEDIFDDEEY
ncbi:hypothetical protein AB6A40_005949 [Gnathostoma spinigerum]|uniref:TATA box-binding protein-like 1 n=1 Tax=Gnathostoma spinigerum TaxID=75299 RepID=A0ABD6EI35_9BILA